MIKTWRSRNNEKNVETSIRVYDSKLHLRYSDKAGYYYITREMAYKDKGNSEYREMLHAKGSIFAEACLKDEGVVCYPVSVKMMESYDAAIRNIMRHLKTEDSKRIAFTSASRRKILNDQNQDLWDGFDHKRKKEISDQTQYYAKDLWRHKMTPKISMTGSGIEKLNG